MNDNNPSLREDIRVVQQFPVPASAGNLITLVDRCWCCNRVFQKYGGTDSALVQEFHHPVPRAFGGSAGPTVSLCGGHHSTLHKIAVCLTRNTSFQHLLPLEKNIAARVLVLANIAARSERTLGSDKNRLVRVSFELPHTENELLKTLSKSERKSVADFVRGLVTREINRQTPSTRR